MAKFRTLDNLDPKGKRVLVRADLNVPVADGKVTDATRIERLAPTIDELAKRGARVVVMSHFGRPKDREPELSLRPIAPALAAALGGRHVAFAEDCIGAPAETAVRGLHDGEIALLENLRFHKGEEKNDPTFAKALAALGDVYVDDAFSAAHRAHASTEVLAHLLPAYAGRLMQAELVALDRALENPEKPVAAIVGGAKVSTKLDLLDNLVAKVQLLIIGGAMANTLLLAEGRSVGKSLVERDMIATARGLGAKAKVAGCELLLPIDAIVARELKSGVPTETVPIARVPQDAMILDIGPQSVALVCERIAACCTLVWNGPVGAFETKPFDKATVAIARQVAALTRAGRLVSVAGGGDTVAALHQAGVVDQLTYVSTAGGAFLEWLEGKTLPGVKALEESRPLSRGRLTGQMHAPVIEASQSDAITRFITRVTLPLIFDAEPAPKVLGTGTLYQAEERTFLVTAAHILKKDPDDFESEDIDFTKIAFPSRMYNATLQTLGDFNVMQPKPPSKVDVAVLELKTPETIDMLSKGWGFLNFSQVRPSSAAQRFILSGYLLEGVRFDGTAIGQALLALWTDRLHYVPEVRDPQPALDQFYYLEKEGERIDGSKREIPSLKGLSGASIWSYTSPSPSQLWDPSRALRVVGVQSTFKRGEWTRCVDWAAVRAIFQSPEVGLKNPPG